MRNLRMILINSKSLKFIFPIVGAIAILASGFSVLPENIDKFRMGLEKYFNEHSVINKNE